MALAVLRRGTQPALARARSWLDAAAGSPLGCWTIAAGTLLVASTPLAGPRGFEAVPSAGEAVAKNLLYLLVAVSLMIPLAFGQDHPGTFVRWLGAPSWRFLGEISYGMFLWHLIVLTAVLHLRGDRLFGGDFIPVLALTLTGTVLLATTSLLVLERPALKLRDWGPGRRTPSQAVRPDEGGIEATAASAAATQS
jgi:peptidoglycan/LPS O-acetylase OafA/YrhL